MNGRQGGALAPHRVLDLTTEPGWLCGRILADLGADVIKVEPPGGDPGRRRGPFLDDQPGDDTGLRWLFQNRGKRSIVIDLDAPDGQGQLRELAATADVLLESFPPGWMAARGLGYPQLAEVNPALVYTAVTPFGQEGPFAGYQGTDLVLAAMGGQAYLTGDPDRPPVRPSVPQFEMHGAAEAAVHTVIALYHALETGEGQFVDVSSQLATIRTLMNATPFPKLEGYDLTRQGGLLAVGQGRFRTIYEVDDGYVTLMVVGGPIGAMIMAQLVRWMDDRGKAPEWLKAIDWMALDFAALAAAGEEGRAEMDRISQTFQDGFYGVTKEEAYDAALRYRFLLAPLSTVADIRADIQLAARGYFVPVDHGERGAVTYAGPWAKLSGTPLRDSPRAPSVDADGPALRAGLAAQAPRVTAAPRDPRRAGTDVFAGLKVWDMSWVGVGPLTARYLADYGATVIRLDSTRKPDTLRLAPPFQKGVPGLNNSLFYGDYNASKLGLGLDLTTEPGREVARDLVAWADVLLESFTPGNMADWGLSYDKVREINPGIVMLSTCMQGQTGPRASYPGYGNLMAGLSGFYEITGWPDRPPVPVYGAYTDFICQRFATSALVSALGHRRRTGEGQHVDLSQYEAALQLLGPELLDYEVNGRTVTRSGNRDRFAAPHGVYPCQGDDSWIAIACHTDAHYQALVSAMGAPGWAVRGELATAEGRRAAVGELDARIAEWTSGYKQEELFAALQPHVPAGPVYSQSQLYLDPQIVHYGYFVDLPHTVMGTVPYNGMQAVLSKTPGRLRKASPCIGEDSILVLEEILGYSPDRVSGLIAEGAVEITTE
jgi:crotonobetainyl-CoA:carnitine CoA-transferase CaiB-like acyl-CoA transferase